MTSDVGRERERSDKLMARIGILEKELQAERSLRKALERMNFAQEQDASSMAVLRRQYTKMRNMR